MYYINCFFVYSILGYLLENIFSLINHLNYESGFLYGPWTVVYGFGSIIIIFIANYISKYNLKKSIEVFLIFITNSLILGIIEILGGYFILFFFHKTFWNYTSNFNITPFTSLEMMIIWGIAALFLTYIIKKSIDHLIIYIPNIITCLCVLLMFIDLFLTVIFNYPT